MGVDLRQLNRFNVEHCQGYLFQNKILYDYTSSLGRNLERYKLRIFNFPNSRLALMFTPADVVNDVFLHFQKNVDNYLLRIGLIDKENILIDEDYSNLLKVAVHNSFYNFIQTNLSHSIRFEELNESWNKEEEKNVQFYDGNSLVICKFSD